MRSALLPFLYDLVHGTPPPCTSASLYISKASLFMVKLSLFQENWVKRWPVLIMPLPFLLEYGSRPHVLNAMLIIPTWTIIIVSQFQSRLVQKLISLVLPGDDQWRSKFFDNSQHQHLVDHQFEKGFVGSPEDRVTKGVIWITEGETQRQRAEQHIPLTALGGCAKSGYAAGGYICWQIFSFWTRHSCESEHSGVDLVYALRPYF